MSASLSTKAREEKHHCELHVMIIAFVKEEQREKVKGASMGTIL